jgi:hypothetical protein
MSELTGRRRSVQLTMCSNTLSFLRLFKAVNEYLLLSVESWIFYKQRLFRKLDHIAEESVFNILV